MNFYKKALVASAIVASFGASAAKITPSTTILNISKEGIANNIAVPDSGFDINVKVEEATPAASNLKIQFGAGVDLASVKTSVETALAANGGVVDNDTAGISESGDMVITFGTGSFTFDNFAVDTTTTGAHFVTFDVSLGQPMANGAAFNVAFASGKVGNASNADYTATDAGTEIDSGSGAIAKETSQYSFSVSTKLDKLIDRDDNKKFTDTTTSDELAVKFGDNQALSRAITTSPVYSATVTGTFTDVVDADLTATGATPTVSTADKVISLDALVLAAVDGVQSEAVLTIDPAADATDVIIYATGETEVSYTITSTDFTAGSLVLATGVDGGEWEVDATIINVPYFPVGYDGVTSTIQLANEGTSDVDVIVTANDQDGNQYGPVNLDTLAGDFASGLAKDAVTKLSAMQVMTLLDAPAESNLSITFKVDANEVVVNGYAFTQKPGTGRTEISTSQQRGN
jgi:hypothetical protein